MTWVATPSKKPVESKGITNAENVDWCLAVAPKSDMEIDFLVVGDAIAAAGIAQVTGTALDWIVLLSHKEE
jgi:hypothetical protein